MAKTINGYRLTTEFTNSNAGMCQWAFACKDDHDYFIKQLLYPKYPTEAAEEKLSPVIVNTMREEAETYYRNRRRFYDSLYKCRTGNVVVVLDFFREKEFYYLVTDRIFGTLLSIDDIAALPDEKKRTLFKAIAYSIIQIHDQGIVHSDLKPENIMVRPTSGGFCTAKLIDFDSGYFESEIPEEIIGDQRYFSPEAILRNIGRDVPITVKSDIFALGLLFHQYWCGDYPYFDRSEYDYASVALLNRAELTLDPSIPDDIRSLIAGMLSKHQEDRPSAKEIWEALSGKEAEPKELPSEDHRGAPEEVDEDDPWHTPTDDDLL